MKALTHITVGRTAIRALLIAVVLTAGIAGSVGTVAAEPIDGKGNDVLYESLDGKGNDPFPWVLYSLDGKGNDVVTESLTGVEDDTVTSAFPNRDYVPVEEIGTVSIQDLTVDGGESPEAVVACGKIRHGAQG